MASNHSNQHDQHIKKKLLALQQRDYDIQTGWQELATQLEKEPLPATKKRPGLHMVTIWKMTAAAIVLLAAGFFTGRMSAGPEPNAPSAPTAHAAHARTGKDPGGATTTFTGPETEIKKPTTAKKVEAQTIDLPQKPIQNLATKRSASTINEAQPGNLSFQGNDKEKLKSIAKTRESSILPAPAGTDPSIPKGPISKKEASQYAANRIASSDNAFAAADSITNITTTMQKENNRSTASIKTTHQPLPVMGLPTINMLPTVQHDKAEIGIIKESIYKKSERQSGFSSNNPFKIRF